MFDRIDESTATSRRESSLLINRDARAIRRSDGERYALQPAAEPFLREPAEQTTWRDQFAILICVSIMSWILFGGVEVFERLWSNVGMVR
jgi:hypothetical protein